MVKYELVLVIKDKDNNTGESLNGIKEILKKNGIQKIEDDIWGHRDLAYPIKKNTTGFYAILTISAQPSVISQINNRLLLREDLLRHLFIKIK